MPEPKHGWNAFRPYRPGDLGHVWANLRADDRQEMEAGGLTDPTQIEELVLPLVSRIVTWDTEAGPVAVLGVTDTEDPDVGLVWAVASTLAVPRWRFAVRNTERALNELGQGFKVLSNFKDTRNINQINWLRKVGFTFINTHRGEGADYHEFVRIIT